MCWSAACAALRRVGFRIVFRQLQHFGPVDAAIEPQQRPGANGIDLIDSDSASPLPSRRYLN